jgi:hypothetical protein
MEVMLRRQEMINHVYSMEAHKLVQHNVLVQPDHNGVFTAKSPGRAGKFMSTLGDVYFELKHECVQEAFKEERDAILEAEIEVATLQDALNEAKKSLPRTYEEYYKRATS